MVDYRFTKNYRLLTSADYKGVFDNVEYKVSCRCILVLAIKHKKYQTRLGIVVSKKSIPKSVERNRIKRLVRESFRTVRSQLPELDVIVLIRRGLDAHPNHTISSKINDLWQDLRTKTGEQRTRKLRAS